MSFVLVAFIKEPFGTIFQYLDVTLWS